MAEVFRYKPLRGRLAPLITLGVKFGTVWYPVEVYVDSGAAYTALHAQIADGISFDYRAGDRVYLQVGDGSFIPVQTRLRSRPLWVTLRGRWEV